MNLCDLISGLGIAEPSTAITTAMKLMRGLKDVRIWLLYVLWW